MSAIRRALHPLGSLLWSTASWLAWRWSQSRLARRAERLPGRVISVGNIQAGGAGKTPLVLRLAAEACARGLRVCVLTRGYRSELEEEDRVGVIYPSMPPVDPDVFGDEPALLQWKLPEVTVAVGPRRIDAYIAAWEKLAELKKDPEWMFDVVILDDAFQNHLIYKDLELVALTSANRNERFFREFDSALERCQFVVWTKGEELPNTAGKPWLRAQYRYPTPPPETRFWFVSGLADGKRARSALEQAGYSIQRHAEFPDHARYDVGWVREFISEAARSGARVLLSGKDWVKWRALGVLESEVFVIEPELVIAENEGEGSALWNRHVWPQS